MKVIQMQQTGMDIPLKIVDTEIPQPQAGEVLIKTRAFAINPVDVKTRKGGGVYGRIKEEMPIVLGWDISGVVAAVGDGVTGFRVGDEVFGMVNFPGHGKAYTEYVTSPATHLALKPNNISHEEAAASTLAALTAYQILNRHIKSGDRVFVQAAAGGVGHFAVQIARIMRATTIGTASGKNESYLKSIGLDEFVNYRKVAFEKVISDVDFALDSMGGDILDRTFQIVKKGGKIIAITTASTPELQKKAADHDICFGFELVVSNGEDMQQIAEWLRDKKLIPHLHQVYDFNEIEAAHQQILLGSTRGKLVVKV